MARLPTPGGDAGTWGDILNEFLRQEHADDGSHRVKSPWVDIRAFGAVPDDEGSASVNVTAFTNAIASGVFNAIVPEGTFYIDSQITLPTSMQLHGVNMNKSVIRLAGTAPDGTDMILCTETNKIENLTVWGNWDGSTSGQNGVGIKCENAAAGYSYNHTFRDVKIAYCKSYGMHLHNSAYTRLYNIKCNASGSDGIYLEGDSLTNACTTITIDGRSVFSDAPYGYGMRVKNAIILNAEFISENTKGVIIEGDHRALNFHDCWFESPVGVIDYIFNLPAGTGGYGLNIVNCWLGMPVSTAVIEGNSNYQKCLAVNNINATGKPVVTEALYNWCILEGTDFTASVLKSYLGSQLDNKSGGSPAHTADTSPLSGYDKYIFMFKNSGLEVAGIDAAGGVDIKQGTWNGGHLRLGNYHLWVDSAGKLRIKNGTPASDSDGTVVGTQS